MSTTNTHRRERASRLGDRVKGKLIVSVQAPPGSPCRALPVIVAMAEASLRNGAAAVRLDSPEHVAAVRQRCPQALIIGLWKRVNPHSRVVITPRFADLEQMWNSGADVVAMDATTRPRPGGEQLEVIVRRARQELGATLMADIDTVAHAVQAAAMGFHWVGTTLYGYTEATAAQQPPALPLLGSLRQHLQTSGALLICEGGIASPQQARQALAAGADAVVVGTAITGIDQQVNRYSSALAEDPNPGEG